MKYLTLVFSLVLFVILISGKFETTVLANNPAPQDSSTQHYIGVKDCGKCHKKTTQGEQLKIWEASAHAKAFETLKSEKAQKIAAEKGIKVPAHESENCLKCHTTGHNLDLSLQGTKFSVEDGVQCETCHGPGSLYKKKTVMKDRAKSIEMGMSPILVADGTAEKQCLECHNEESPTFKPFDFKEQWKKIAHPVPGE